jgi:acyl-CoA thioester hydrolase
LTHKEVLGTEVTRGNVLPEWIDVNDHMNVAYYLLAFDQGVDSLWEQFGITLDHINVTNSSTFAVESHITWQRELALDEPFIVTSQLLAYDEKRIHQFMRMYHAEHHFLAATAEWLNLHVDLSVRKVAPWPDKILKKIAEFAQRQQEWGWPDEAGRRMGVPKPLYSASGKAHE